MHCWQGPKGIKVEVIRLDQKQRIKVTQDVGGRHYLLGYYGRIEQIVRHVDLADLVEVIDLPVSPEQTWREGG